MNIGQKGFTLIELLIVIALLGALVIGLLTALDPIEQIRRGQDTGIRNTGSEFFNAVNRYYTNKGQFPWTATYNSRSMTQMGSDVSALMQAGELKSNFYDRVGSANLSKILVTSTSATDLWACFQPISKGMQEDPSTIFGSDGATTGMASCKSQTSGTGGNNCYICFH